MLGGWLGWVISEAFSALGDPDPDALFLSPMEAVP